jgi:hypothetical protein
MTSPQAQAAEAKARQAAPAPPPAIPGAQSKTDAAAPAVKPPSDLAPNEALFDAINRGDMTAARDALNRGAELDARNVLGMTPLDLSVDLGRNDITFLLLSMRGDSGGSRLPPKPTQTAQAPAPPPVRHGRAVAERRAHVVMTAAVPAAASPRPAPASQKAPLYAGNGGAPIPQAGFLGFDPATGR